MTTDSAAERGTDSPDWPIAREVRIPMRDGVELAANLYLPAEPGPHPALLQYTPYLKDGMGGRGVIEVGQLALARRGFACVSLDFRGYGESDGVPQPAFAPAEKFDGHDALEWIATQPWCTGRTGIWGISYGGNTGLSIASTKPPSLGAIVAIHAIDNEYTGAAWPHGCRGALVGEVDWGFRVSGIQLLPPLRFGDAWEARWRTRLEQIQEPFSFGWHTIPPETWASWATDIEAIDVPTWAVSAWHDSYPRETVAYHDRLSGPRRLLLGPWKHELPDFAVHNPVGFFDAMADWFDEHLRGGATAPGHPPVTFFETLGRGWRGSATWPPATSAVHEFYPGPAGSLSAAATPAGEDVHLVDPSVGLAALPWDWTTPTPIEPPDISPDDHRSLTWTTEPFEAGLTITGGPEVVVVLRSDRPDVPLHAWLSDVGPTGFSTLICQGWIRPSHVVGEPLDASRSYELRVPLAPTSYRLPEGHRLRLAVAGAHFPALVSAPEPVTFRVTRSGATGTRLLLPIEAGPSAASSAADLAPSPFGAPEAGKPTATLEARGEHRVQRSLDDASAVYEQRRVARSRLEGGVELTWELDSEIGVERDRPAGVVMTSRQVWRVTNGPVPIEVRLAMLETFGAVRMTAAITVDDRPFFEREWTVDLDAVPWQIRR